MARGVNEAQQVRIGKERVDVCVCAYACNAVQKECVVCDGCWMRWRGRAGAGEDVPP